MSNSATDIFNIELSYDSFGRMTYDGLNDVHMEYNAMDLVRKVTRGSEVLVNYSYLADGTKLSALDVDGEGLVYRGPFVYRQITDAFRVGGY